MGQISPKFRRGEGDVLMFWCPGCMEIHSITYKPGGWTWNGDVNKATFSPSILVRSGHFLEHRTGPGGCYCDFEERFGYPPEFACRICHSFVTDGEIRFLEDSSHTLAGQTVPLPDLPPGYRDERFRTEGDGSRPTAPTR